METKLCWTCWLEKPIEDFPMRAWEQYPYCRECYNKSKLKYSDRNVKHIADILLESGGCAMCWETDITCLDFHHRDPSKKEMSVMRLWASQRSIATIDKEIAKCDILCSNCHRMLHAAQSKSRLYRIQWWENLEER